MWIWNQKNPLQNNKGIDMSNVKYFVVEDAENGEDGDKYISHFTKEEVADQFLNSEFVKTNYPDVVGVKTITFQIYDNASTAEEALRGELVESALSKLTDRERRALNLPVREILASSSNDIKESNSNVGLPVN